VTMTLPHSPAAVVIRPGDRVLDIDGKSVSPDAIPTRIAAHGCPQAGVSHCHPTPVRLTLRRNGAIRHISVTPQYDQQTHSDKIGIDLGTQHIPTTVGQAAGFSLTTMVHISDETVNALTRVFNSRQRKQLSGIVGTYQATAQAFAFSWPVALLVLGVISLSLALINLLPFLPLDGGHIYWALIEKLRGRPVPLSSINRSMFIGVALILILFAIGLDNDIGRLGQNLIGT
jgi:regulator of sigma E protease